MSNPRADLAAQLAERRMNRPAQPPQLNPPPTTTNPQPTPEPIKPTPQGRKVKTTFGLTPAARQIKRRWLAHWCIDNDVPMDSVVSTLIELLPADDQLQRTILARLHGDTSGDPS